MKVKRICEWCGKVFYVYPSIVKLGRGKYCSKNCMYNWRNKYRKEENNPQYKRVSQRCLVCGKTFKTLQSIIENGRGKYCSKECRHIGRKRGKIVKCKTCGKEFYVRPAELREGKKYCSNACRSLGKRKGEYRKCQMCGKEFYVPLATIKAGKGKFCSSRCALKAIPSSQTIPELIFADISKKNEIPSEYTGDKSLWIGRINPDYVYYNGRKRYAIFINGDYWHSPFLRPNMRKTQRPEYQIKTCKENKWIPLIIWESDLKREDAEAFVLNLLKKEGIIA